MLTPKEKKQNEDLVTAAGKGDIEAVKRLLDQKADVKYISRDRDDVTALHEAARAGHLELIRLLLSRGADIDQQDKLGQTALMIAVLTASTKPDNSDSQLAVVTLLLAKGADVFVKNKSQETALLCAKHGRGGGIIGQKAPQAKRLTQLDRIIGVLRTWEDRVGVETH